MHGSFLLPLLSLDKAGVRISGTEFAEIPYLFAKYTSEILALEQDIRVDDMIRKIRDLVPEYQSVDVLKMGDDATA